MEQPASPRSAVGVVAWVAAIVVGGAAAVRTFGSGLLLNWDQVVGPTIPMPPGFFGLGPELPRRVPFYGPLALASEVVGGPNVVAVLIWSTVAVACLGVVRLIGRNPVGVLLGVVYALSPFLLSRLAVGHLPLAVATALLPHALVDLGDRRRRWQWAIVFGFTGSSGTVLGLVPLLVATLRRERSGERLRSLIVLVAAQAVWVVPGLVVLVGGSALPSAASALFQARADGVLGPARAVAGGGLFLVDEDVATRAPVLAAVLGLSLLLGLAGLVGRQRSVLRPDDGAASMESIGPDLIWSALVGLGLFVVPTVPGVRTVWENALVGPLVIVRETHKFWPLFGLVLLVGLGSVLGRRGALGVAAGAGLAALAMAVGWSGLWGADGRLTPLAEPASLAAIRAELADGDHVVLALPWERYGPSSLAGGRATLEPSPWLLDGRILASGRAFASVDSDERTTVDDEKLAGIDTMVRAGSTVADELRDLGIDRVVVMGSPDAAFYRRLGREPGVRQLVGSSESPASDVDASVLLFAIDDVPVSIPPSNDAGAVAVLATQLLALFAALRLFRPGEKYRPVTASG